MGPESMGWSVLVQTKATILMLSALLKLSRAKFATPLREGRKPLEID